VKTAVHAARQATARKNDLSFIVIGRMEKVSKILN